MGAGAFGDVTRSEVLVAGLSYRSTELEVRERHAIGRDDLPAACASLIASGVAEAVVVSTCNRVEAYVVPGANQSDADAVAAIRNALQAPTLSLYTHTGTDAVRHLFRVAGSLDSMVLGEPQILGQVKEAFEVAREAGSVAVNLHGTFTRAFRAAKRIRTDTDIARSAVSVGHVAVELAKTIFSSLADVNVLLVGAGKMGVLAATHLASSGAKKVLVTNRTFERGQRLADQHGWAASAYGDLPFLLSGVDVVICSTGATTAVLTRDLVKAAIKQRRYRPLFLIDIAVPRDIDPAVASLDGVYLYNIDDLEEVSRTNAAGRSTAVTHAERIIEDELRALAEWKKERGATPTIQQLREGLLAVAHAEADKTIKMLPALDERGHAAVRKLSEVIVGRILRGPLLGLRQGVVDADGVAIPAHEVARVVRALFELESAPADERKQP